MSGSIGRSYLIQSWNDASSYSGEQIGQRLKQSTELFLKNGHANTALFAEPEAPKKPKKPVPIAHQIIPQHRTLNRLDQQELSLHKAYKNEEVSLEEYEELLYALDQKRERAFRSVNKALGRPLDDEAVGYDGEEDKTLNWYDKALTKGGFEGNLGGVEGLGRKNLKSDIKMFLLYSILGCILIMYLAN